MSKVTEREKARALRREGKSVGEIQVEVGVSKGSVSRWVRDIELTPEQIKELRDRNPCYNRGGNFGSNGLREKHKAIREQFQERGREDAKKGDNLHRMGCILYWAEGAKNRTTLSFGNSDNEMMKLFVRFLRKCFGVAEEDITVRIQCYSDVNVREAESYWLSELGLNKTSLRKSVIDCRPRSSKHKGKARKLNFGICVIIVCDVELVQRIFGAIQEYGGFRKECWVE